MPMTQEEAWHPASVWRSMGGASVGYESRRSRGLSGLGYQLGAPFDGGSSGALGETLFAM